LAALMTEAPEDPMSQEGGVLLPGQSISIHEPTPLGRVVGRSRGLRLGEGSASDNGRYGTREGDRTVLRALARQA
jgi:hypothetical protein